MPIQMPTKLQERLVKAAASGNASAQTIVKNAIKKGIIQSTPEVIAATKTTTTPPSGSTDQTVDPLVQEAIDKLGKTTVDIYYRTPSGEIKVTETSNAESLLANLPGEFLKIVIPPPGSGAYKVYKYTKDNKQVVFDVSGDVLATPSEKDIYLKTGNVPEYVREQVNLSEDIKQKLRATGKTEVSIQANESEYERIAYQKYLGMDVSSREQSFNEYLNSQIQVKQPIAKNVKQIAGEQWAELGKQEYGPIKQASLAISSSYLAIYDINYWLSSDKQQYFAERQVQAVKEIQSGEAWKTWVGVQAPAYENVIIPLATGGAFKYISLGGKAVKAGTLASKAYKVWNVGQKVIQYGVVPVTIGTDIGITAAKTGGFTSKETLGKIGTLGVQFAIMGAGYKYYEPGTPKVEVIAKYGTQGKVQEFSIQKYKEIFGRQIKYGQEIIIKPKVSTGLEPNYDTYTGARYIDTYKTLMGTNKTSLVTIKGTLKPAIRTTTGYEPNLDTYTGARYIDTYRTLMGGDLATTPIRIKGTLKPAIQVFTGWEPSYEGYRGSDLIKSTSLSTRVWPKPMLAEEYVPWNAYLESGRAFYEREPIVSLKINVSPRIPKQKIFTFKDIILEVELPKGSQISGGRLKTILMQEPKIETKSKTLQTYKPLTEKQYLETMLQQKLEYKGYQEPKTKYKLLFEEPMFVYTYLSQQQQMQQPKINQQQVSRQRFGIINISQQATSQDLISNQIQKNIQTQMQDIIQNQNKIQFQIQPQISIQDIAQQQIQWQDQIQQQMQGQIQETIKIQLPEQIYETKQKYKFRKRFEDDVMQDMAKYFKAYNVLIKEQYIFGGVKTKYPQYQRINIQPLTKESAYSLLATKLKQTARASGMIEATEGRPTKQKSAYDWLDVASEFYEKQGIIIQKASKRIGTPGELKEITYKGLAARRRR